MGAILRGCNPTVTSLNIPFSYLYLASLLKKDENLKYIYLRRGRGDAGGHDVRVRGSVDTAGHQLHTGGVGTQVSAVVVGCTCICGCTT